MPAQPPPERARGPWSEKPGLSVNALHAISCLVNTAFGLLFFGGAGYAVFVQDRTPWWFAVALLLYVMTHVSFSAGKSK